MLAREVVKDHATVDPDILSPIQHQDLTAAVGLSIACCNDSDVDEAHHTASTHMALIDMLRDTVVTLSHQRAQLDIANHEEIADLNSKIADSIADLYKAVYDPANAVLSRSVRIPIAP